MNFTNTKSVWKVVSKQVVNQVCDQLRSHVRNDWHFAMNVQVYGGGYVKINPIQRKIKQEIRK